MVLTDGSSAHVLAGGIAGTTGAIITSPLEIVKTRLQSSVVVWSEPAVSTQAKGTFNPLLKMFQRMHSHTTIAVNQTVGVNLYSHSAVTPLSSLPQDRMSIFQCLRHIYRTEGMRALYKGLSMNLLGVLPSRAVYFGTYFNGQEYFSSIYAKGSHANVILAAACASFVSSTLTNPIWLVKTRLQLDQSPSSKPLSVMRCVQDTWQQGGALGFYKGIQASYIGIAETSLHFVLYEYLKRILLTWSHGPDVKECCVSRADEVFYCSVASLISKSTSTIACYPHEVLRTRLRQEGNKYTGLMRTVQLVMKEEGPRAFYKGMLTHFVRQLPNTCIVLTTYEAVLHFIRSHRSVCVS